MMNDNDCCYKVSVHPYTGGARLKYGGATAPESSNVERPLIAMDSCCVGKLSSIFQLSLADFVDPGRRAYGRVRFILVSAA